VLEHIFDVPVLMKTLTQLLKQGGLLFICVPDASRYRDFDFIPFDYFNVEHINHFDETSLLNLGFHHGFSIVDLFKTTVTLSNTTQPMVFCAFANNGETSALWPSYSRDRIADYVRHTQNNARIKTIIDQLIETREEVVIWGAGNFTSRLLADYGLDLCNIAFFVDRDRHKQGKKINGIPVCAPDALPSTNSTATILVVAAVFHDEIVADVEALGIKNRVVVLR
jgi:FlaA1/EpsC-like NDP-sugar epimerase